MHPLRHPILDDTGQATGATFEVDGDSIIYHSRGTTEGSRAYRAGLELLLVRLEKKRIGIRSIHVDTRTTKHLPATQRRIFLGGDHPYPTRAELMTAAAKVGRPPGAKGGGNGNKRLRIRVHAPLGMLQAIQAITRK